MDRLAFAPDAFSRIFDPPEPFTVTPREPIRMDILIGHGVMVDTAAQYFADRLGARIIVAHNRLGGPCAHLGAVSA